jgi:hypothetical protein
MGIDPIQALLMGTALTRAGATSTKSGTWLREMAIRAMPGTTIFESEKKAERHDELLKRLGLLDDKDKATWFTDGKPDLFKMLDIAGRNLDKIPMSDRAGVERKLFGAQGSGGLALLTDPAVREQIQSLRKEMDSPEFKNRYAGFVRSYQEGSTVQNARTGMAQFNNTMMDIGRLTLPSVNYALGAFRSELERIKNLLPSSPKLGDGSIGGSALLGAGAGVAAGATVGAFGGPVGAAGGAVVGGVLGIAHGFMESMNERFPSLGYDRGGTYTSPGKTGRPAEKIEVKPQPITLNLNLDGHTLAQAVSGALQSYYNFGTGAAAADGTGQPFDGGHNTTDH